MYSTNRLPHPSRYRGLDERIVLRILPVRIWAVEPSAPPSE